MAPTTKFMMCFVLVVSLAGQSLATEYVVGGDGGWNLNVDLAAWISGITLHVGDVLVFKYPVGVHGVAQVDLLGFLACNATAAIFTDNSGLTKITLTKPQIYYFIALVNADCNLGLKLPCPVLL